jgi:hypothetical protein
MHSADKADDNTREELSPYEDQTREYRAMRGKRTGGNRVLFLLFVPNDGIGAGWVAALEAFDPDRRDRPRGDVPVIESVQFYRRPEAEPSAKGEGLHLVKRN